MIGRLVDGRWVFLGKILFNNTQSESLSLLNNGIGLSKEIVGNEQDYICGIVSRFVKGDPRPMQFIAEYSSQDQ